MKESWVSLGLIILGMGAITYAIRASLILLLGRVAIPPLIRRGLRFVPPAVLAAIVVPELLQPAGTVGLGLLNPRLLAGALAGLIAWRSRNIFLAIGAGMLALWLLQAALP